MRDTIEGVRELQLTPHNDERGAFTELYCEHWDTPISPTQWSLVASKAEVFRGMHVHTRHDEFFSVISGHAVVGLVDIRPTSSTYLTPMLIELPADVHRAVAFPRGLLHGWYFPEPTVHIQAVSEAYAFYSEDDNNGCRWDDPALPITWPFERCVTSPRHDEFGPFQELLVRLESQLRPVV